MKTENRWCKCGQAINVEHSASCTFRADGMRFFVPEEKSTNSCLFRCPSCVEVVEYSKLLDACPFVATKHEGEHQ